MSEPIDLDALAVLHADTEDAAKRGSDPYSGNSAITRAGLLAPAVLKYHNAIPELLRLARIGQRVEQASPETVERVARALCEHGGHDPDERMPNDGVRWRYYAPPATAALRALAEPQP